MNIINAQVEVLKEALKNKKSPIYIYEDYNMVGLVLPVIVSDKIKTR